MDNTNYCLGCKTYNSKEDPKFIEALSENTLFNNERLKTLDELGGPTVLEEFDGSFNWFLRWWLYRYDFLTAVKIANECCEKEIDFRFTNSLKPLDYFKEKHKIETIHGAKK